MTSEGPFHDGGGTRAGGRLLGEVDAFGRMGRLSESLDGDALTLARTLRWLLRGTGMTLNQYAGHVYISKSVVSRYLSGERVPDGQFLGTLLTCWAEHQDPPLGRTGQDFARRLTELTALQRNVLRATHPAQYEEQLAADDRNNAQARLEELEQEVRRQKRDVAERERELEQLRRELRELTENTSRRSGELGKEIELRRKHEVVLLSDLRRMETDLGRVRQELAEALRERDEALAECERLERELAAAQNAADRERLQEDIAKFVGEAAEAAQRVQFRRAELEQVTAEAAQVKAEAERTRAEAAAAAARLLAEADKDAQSKREEGIAVFEEARTKAAQAAQAALEFETTLARRREQSERDLAARRAKAERDLAEIEHRAEQLRLEAEKLSTDVERRSRQTIETAQRQGEDIVADANAKADRVRSEAERELAELISRRDSMDAQLTNVREMLAVLTSKVITAIEPPTDDSLDMPAQQSR